MRVENTIFAVLSLIFFIEAVGVVRSIRALKLWSANAWVVLGASMNIILVILNYNKPTFFIISIINALLFFTFYLQPTFRVSKYLSLIFIPLAVALIILSLIA
ncbi:hypothetical protein COT77_00360 [Candidatus Berkelbacteria bacterium CG10_big_fil_rev_8_21_14_0_10_41_12]|uniref:Uncharacterized protein n=1 Tax=Candidatus Berkelbacteria bacterium CG10_big_fil_rev_8_21_14_0_10_41_12 TaxID=1974513 RepID=A0A2M6WY09_9BACT|nr:MAG: hypothetical protein COT77_00360 [Candidatus Berkelbacteria bacterium CG10_big_fil_rev_8_21_14_0_10_41_12]